MVLPVPESPANRAVTPWPRPPPRRIRQSVSTVSRCRARAATSRSPRSTGGSQHEVVPADLRLDPPGQPFQTGRVLGPYAAAEVVGRHRAAGQPGGGFGRPYGPADLGRARGPGARPDRAGSSDAVVRARAPAPTTRSRSRPPSGGRLEHQRAVIDHCGSQVDVPTSSTGTGAVANSCTASAAPRRAARPGPATSPPPRSRASRTARPTRARRHRVPSASRRRSTATDATARPAPAPRPPTALPVPATRSCR